MTPDQAIDYLKRNRQYLNISGLAKAAGISPTTLANYLTGYVDKNGYARTIPIMKLWALAEVVKKLKEG